MNTGVIGLTHGSSTIARGIQFFMKLYRKLRGLPIAEVYNHAFIITNIGDALFVNESIFYGVERTRKVDTYPNDSKILYLEFIEPLTKAEQNSLMREINYMLNKEIPYDFINFFYQILLILTGKWYGPTGSRAEKRMYCSEFVATVINKIRPNTFVNPAATNPEDIRLNVNFKVYANN